MGNKECVCFSLVAVKRIWFRDFRFLVPHSRLKDRVPQSTCAQLSELSHPGEHYHMITLKNLFKRSHT